VRPAILLTTAVLLILGTACKGGDDNKDEDLRQGLLAMTLQQTDVPEGLQSIGGAFTTNADAASGLGGGPSLEQFEAWGRILGYGVDHQASEPGGGLQVLRVESTASLYRAAQGAADSFKERVARAQAADWQLSHSDLAEFMQEELARDIPVDDLYWLHLSGYQQTGTVVQRLVSDDIIVFRVGRAWGFLNVVSIAAPGEDDRSFMLTQVEALLLKQIQHTRDGLDSGLLD
jgi:hypothetical protein